MTLVVLLSFDTQQQLYSRYILLLVDSMILTHQLELQSLTPYCFAVSILHALLYRHYKICAYFELVLTVRSGE